MILVSDLMRSEQASYAFNIFFLNILIEGQGVISDHGMLSGFTPYVTLPLGKIFREGMMVYLAVGNSLSDAEFTIRASVRPYVVDGSDAEVMLYGLLNGIPQVSTRTHI